MKKLFSVLFLVILATFSFAQSKPDILKYLSVDNLATYKEVSYSIEFDKPAIFKLINLKQAEKPLLTGKIVNLSPRNGSMSFNVLKANGRMERVELTDHYVVVTQGAGTKMILFNSYEDAKNSFDD